MWDGLDDDEEGGQGLDEEEDAMLVGEIAGVERNRRRDQPNNKLLLFPAPTAKVPARTKRGHRKQSGISLFSRYSYMAFIQDMITTKDTTKRSDACNAVYSASASALLAKQIPRKKCPYEQYRPLYYTYPSQRFSFGHSLAPPGTGSGL